MPALMNDMGTWSVSFHEQGTTGPGWLVELRRAAFECFLDRGFPTMKDEAWKYTPIGPIVRTAFHRPGRSVAVEDHLREACTALVGGGRVVLLVDGQIEGTCTAPDRAGSAEGLRVSRLVDEIAGDDPLLRRLLREDTGEPADPFVLLNTAFLEEGSVVRVAPGANVAGAPILLASLVSDDPDHHPAIHPRNLVHVGAGGHAVVVEHMVGPETSTCLDNPVIDIELEENATLEHCRVIHGGVGTFHVGAIRVRQQAGSTLRSHVVSLGGSIVRTSVSVDLDGEGGHCEISGLFLGAGDQLVDNYLLIHHNAPHCESRQFFKGVLEDRSRGVFSGAIHVAQDAQKTDAKQTNMNLLLSDEARVDTRPQLEINADDVRCTHGATIGRLDEEALFYLRSRGIDEGAARSTLIRAFAEQPLATIRLACLRETLVAEVEARFAPPQEPA